MATNRALSTEPQQVMGPEQRSRVRFHSTRLMFDGVAENYEKWEVKFLAHLRLQGLKKVVTASDEADINADQNEEVYAELVQVLDDKSLTLIMRADLGTLRIRRIFLRILASITHLRIRVNFTQKKKLKIRIFEFN